VRTAQTGARGHGIATGVRHTLDSSNGQAVVSFDAYNNRDLPALNVANPLTRNGCAAAAITDEPVVGSDVEQSVVRRLTPVECERLQGLPDDWTAIPFRGRTVAADQNRYKAIGNGWAVPVVRWILDRLDRVRAGQSI
jgi:DNA (cytosine-5)-methyltransferase 1